jgi:RNAse (barnase) inhibitor barstar
MTSVQKNNLLWVQYTPGAVGRILLICTTTSSAVGNWISDPLPDPVEFTTNHLCSRVSSDHMNNEPQTPYDISWYTRNVMFTRGDNLTTKEVYAYLQKDSRAVSDLKQGKLLANGYQKPYIPTWFKNEKLITIYNDQPSLAWLLNRRKEVFYKWFDNEVHLLRYKQESAPIRSHAKLYDPTKHIYSYTDADKFVKQDFEKENVVPGSGLNISLSTVLSADLDSTWDLLDEYLTLPVNRHWCNIAMETWRSRWVQ